MAWLSFTDAFLSIVEPPAALDPTGTHLLVRARAKGDIERVFPEARVTATPERDYAFRALIPRREAAIAIGRRIAGISYGNHKAAVSEEDRHDAYLSCWAAMLRFQQGRAQARGRQPRRRQRQKRLPWGWEARDDVPF